MGSSLVSAGFLLGGSAGDLVNSGDADLNGFECLLYFRNGTAWSQVLGDGPFAQAKMGGQILVRPAGVEPEQFFAGPELLDLAQIGAVDVLGKL